MGKYINNSLVISEEKVIREGKVSFASIVPHIFLMLIVIGFFSIWKPIFKLFTTELAYTNKRLLGKTGIIKTEEMNSPLSAIQNIKVQNGLFGKIFNYGNISISTASGTYVFNYIKHATEFKNMLSLQIEEYKKAEMEENALKIAQAMRFQNT